MTLDPLELAREAYRRQDWPEAYARLTAIDRETPLGLDDRERLATAAFLTVHTAESEDHLARGYHEAIEQRDLPHAARFAFWLGIRLMFSGEMARGGGWLTRAREAVEEYGDDCAERGYVLVPEALMAYESGDLETAQRGFGAILETGLRFQDIDLITMGRLGTGQCLTRLDDTRGGMALLDEAMVAVTADEVSPIVAGIAYCTVIEMCLELFDVARAQEWTAALSRWCDRHPDRAPFQGHCLVRRAELLQLRGAWPDAVIEAERARERLEGDAMMGFARYVQAELHRLLGEFASAEEGYRDASRWGYHPQPGLALLRLAQGQPGTAARAIRAAVAEPAAALQRCRLLGAFVEIMIATGDIEAARDGAEQLSACAVDAGAPLLEAIASHATGAVRLAEGDAQGALAALEDARQRWQAIVAPYEAARTRLLMARARRAMGDEDTAELDLDAARAVFAELGAEPALAELDGLEAGEAAAPENGTAAGGLTPRELEVLRLVATGATNRVIASELVISEKTVARHLSSIFTKLDLPSRAAATAWAYEHGLVATS